jgi:predicted AAA+ superfamily ATPase
LEKGQKVTGKRLLELIEPYSPWLTSLFKASWQEDVPQFRRPVFGQLLQDLHASKQILSITGPRRVGKSTLLQQLIVHLMERDKVAPSRVWYFSMDDPAMFRPGAIPGDQVIEDMVMSLAAYGTEKSFLFLDEIQRADRWELSLKKCYDLKYPVRIVISGSASSPIFKKSRESLLGRVTDYHVLPFSFREFLLYQLGNDTLVDEVKSLRKLGGRIMALLTRGGRGGGDSITLPVIPELSIELRARAEKELERYLVDGGFPEVWAMPSQAKKIEYLFDNQVKKVIYEDLTLATEFRKPEELKTFYISLLERPGAEVNLEKMAREVGINVQQIKKYLPLLEMTDLIRHAEKFRGSARRLRHGNRKFYLVDIALRNAVLRIRKELLHDEDILGLYAENLVFNALKKQKGILQVDYYREGAKEVDFVSHVRPQKFWPIEVGYRSSINDKDLNGIRDFCKKYACLAPMVVTKSELRRDSELTCLPLVMFLLLFD